MRAQAQMGRDVEDPAREVTTDAATADGRLVQDIAKKVGAVAEALADRLKGH
jgi:hypothetical protein